MLQLLCKQIWDFFQLTNILHKDPQLSQKTLEFPYLVRNVKYPFVLHHHMVPGGAKHPSEGLFLAERGEV